MAGRFLQSHRSNGYSPATGDEDGGFSASEGKGRGDTAPSEVNQEERERQALTEDDSNKADVKRMARLFLLIGIATTFPWNSLLTSLPIFTITYFPTYKWGMWT